MKGLPLLLFFFTILSLTFFILLVFIRIPFPPFPLMSYQDAFDLLTPLVLIPLYWLMFKFAADEPPSLAEGIVFQVLAAFWVVGQGIHLGANSISNLIEALARSNQIDATGSDIFRLTYLYDELLGHYLWHIGVLGLAALLIYREWRHPAGRLTNWLSTILFGFIYGLILFIITVEGQTVWVGLPFVLLVSLFGFFQGRKKIAERPLFAFFLVSCLLALLLYAVWGFRWGGFPGFFEVGIIK